MWMHSLGYGHPGGVLPDAKGKVKVARRNEAGRFYDGGTKLLVDRILPLARGGPAVDSHRTWQQLVNQDLGSVPLSIAQEYMYQSYVASSPATFDPTIGAKVVVDGDTVMYADDTVVSWLRDDKVVDAFDFESPILSISPKLCRTRRGVMVQNEETYRSVFVGDTMDACFNDKIAVLTALGELKIIDTESNQQYNLPRGSKSGWGRIQWAGSSLMWANRQQAAFVDFRSPSEHDRQIVLDFSDRFRKVVDMSVVSDNNVFVLSSKELSWVDLRMRKQVLAWDHFFGGDDPSLKVGNCQHSSNLVFISSQLHPFLTFYTLGSGGVSERDPYYIETWPTISPQSAAAIPRENQIDMYITVGEGGLYKQVLTPNDTTVDGFERMPPPSTPEPIRSPAEQHDYDFSSIPNNATILGFDNLAKWVVDMQRPDLPSGPSYGTVLKAMGFTKETFIAYCEDMWIKPLQDQRLADRRREAIERIADDLGTYDNANVDLPEIELPPDVQRMSDNWDAADAAEEAAGEATQVEASQETNDFYAATQPERSFLPASQPIELSLSQPLPSKKAKKKVKKRKRTEGFG